MSRIQISHLTFAYEGSAEPVFNDVSFQLDTDWKLGFVGRNGRGKTTLLRILAGQLPHCGAVSASVQFDYFPFPVSDPNMTPLEIATSMDREDQIWRFLKEANCLAIEEDAFSRPFSSLSGGEQAKVLLALLFAKENHFLLIDEPTNHLDLWGRQLVSRYLNGKKGFILVSHDRAFLDGCVDHILSINRATIDVQQGNFSSWEENKRRQDQHELEENERLKQDIQRLRDAQRRMADWSNALERTKVGQGACDRGYIGAKSAKMMRHSKATETRKNKEIAEKEKLLKNLEKADDLKIFPLRHPAPRLMEIRDAAIGYTDERTVLKHISLEIKNGDIWALSGRNGSGKTSLLRLIAGEIHPISGTVRRASGLILSIVPQQAKLSGPLEEWIQKSGVDETQMKTILRKLDFSRDQFIKDMASFSAGQQKKVLIARSLCQKAHLYLWDEPLNYIDVISRMQIEQLIAAFHPTMVLAEHDEAFLRRVGAHLVTI